jgi:hypothetical protein
MRAQIEQAARDHLGAPFALVLRDGNPSLPELPSLVLVAEDRRRRHRAQVEAEARENPRLRALVSAFDATIASTRPLHEP